MKILIATIIAAMTLSVSVSAETITASKKYVTKSVNVGNFKAITTTSSVDVEYTPSPVKKVEIYAPDNVIQFVDVNVSGSTLKVGYKSKSRNLNIRGKYKTVVRVSGPGVTAFTTLSSGDIDIKSALETTSKITFTTSSSGDIDATSVKCATISATTQSSGDIDIDKATCTKLIATTRSSGDIKIAKASCTNLIATTGSSGDIEIDGITANTVEATTQSSGDIKLNGSCKTAILTTGSSGDIKAGNLSADSVNASTKSSGDITCKDSGNITKSKSSSGEIRVR